MLNVMLSYFVLILHRNSISKLQQRYRSDLIKFWLVRGIVFGIPMRCLCKGIEYPVYYYI